MSFPIIFRRAARAEFDDAIDWYEQRQAGLGATFADAAQKVLDRIAVQPDFYPQVFRGAREAFVSGFPYCVYYREEAGRVFVFSIFHTARNPTIWQSRV
jgi:toxin ParE1/3/4